MTLREILAAFVEVEKGLSITEPAKVTVERSYLLLPNQTAEVPCFLHQYRPLTHKLGPNESRERDYQIKQQMLVARLPGNQARKSEIAAAFDEAISIAFAAAVKLKDPSVYLRRDGEEANFQPMVLEWAKIAYVGLEYHYRVTTHDTVLVAP